jgi:hypothetical protein
LLLTSKSHQEIVWFYVSMQKTIFVHKLNALDHLICYHANRL